MKQGARPEDQIARFVAAYNSFDIDGMIGVLAPDVRFENYSGDALTASTTGIAEFRRLAEQSKTLFSEREQRITSVVQGEDSVLVAIAYRGRLAADIPNGPVAGSLLELQGTSEYFFRDDKIHKLIDRS